MRLVWMIVVAFGVLGASVLGVERAEASEVVGEVLQLDERGPLYDKPLVTTPLPLWGILAMAGAGLGMIVLSFLPFGDVTRGLLLVGGALTIIAAPTLWIVLGLLVPLVLIGVLMSIIRVGTGSGGGGLGGGFGGFIGGGDGGGGGGGDGGGC